MRIRIKTDDGKKFNINLPMWVVRIGLSKAAKKWIKKKVPEETKKQIDDINFSQLSKSFAELKAYKGLQIVDIKDKDGTEISIIV